MAIDCTLLTAEQIYGSKNLFDQIGTRAAVTDFAILLGAYVDNNYYAGEEKLENRTGWYWTRSDDGDSNAQVVTSFGSRFSDSVHARDDACRPIVPSSSISKISTNGVSSRNLNGVLEIEYGNYPQKAVSKQTQLELENLFQRRELKITGNKFTVDTRKYDEYEKEFKAKEILEYEYQGKYYVRVEANTRYDGKKVQLSNGEYYQDGDPVWVEVSPVKWFLDEKSGLMISEKLLFAGIQFCHEKNYKGDFSKTDLKTYLDRYFAKELTIREQSKEQISEKLEHKNDKIEALLEEIENMKAKFLEEKKTLLEKVPSNHIQNKEKIKK